MNPIIKKSLEVVMEAIFDAGVNLSELQGSRTAVFSVTGSPDGEIFAASNTLQTQSGWLRSETAHRISYFLKMKGPSCGVVTDCSGSFVALDMAISSIRIGKCDNAIVVSGNLLQHPEISRQIAQLGALSLEGIGRAFDQAANGYVRAEAVVAVFLQKAKNSRRAYGKITHVRTGCEGYKTEGILVPSSQMQADLIRVALLESGVDPSEIGYLEAHGTGTLVGDPREAASIDTIVAKKRQTPLPIGAIKNSIGHSESTSELSSLTKAVIAMETGLIPPTINVNRVKTEIEGFDENRMRVVTEAEKLPDGAYICINSFGWGGSITHLILERFVNNRVDDVSPIDDIPRLVLVSGRSKDAILDLLEDLNQHFDQDYLGLINQIFKKNVKGHAYRGFSILTNHGSITTSVQSYEQHTTNLFVFFGPFESGFQILNRHLIKIPLVKNVTERIFKCLLKQKINFDDNEKNAIMMAFTVRLGLVHVLKLLKLKLTLLANDQLYHLLILYYSDKIELEETIAKAYQIIVISQWNQIYHFGEFPSVPKHSVVLNVSDKPLKNNDEDLFLTNNFLYILGRLYQQGQNPQIHKLYPEVQFPVRRNTPTLSHLLKWKYDKNWYAYRFSNDQEDTPLQKVHKISYENCEYLTGYQIQGAEKCNLEISVGWLRWESNWTTFLDSMLQMVLLQDNTNSFCEVTSIRRLTIDAQKHVKIVTEKKLCPFYAYKNCKIIKSGGVEIFDVITKRVNRHYCQKPVLEKHVFVPNVVTINLEQSLRVNTQIMIEKTLTSCIKAVEIFDRFSTANTDPLLPLVHQILEETPSVISDFVVCTQNNLKQYRGVTVKNVFPRASKNLLLVIVTKALQKPAMLKQILSALGDDGFILAREELSFYCKDIENLEVLTEHVTPYEKLILLQKSKLVDITEHIGVSWRNLNWLPRLQNALKDKPNVTIYSDNLEPEGVLGLTSCLRLEPEGKKLRCFFMMEEAPEFDHQLHFYKKQIKKNFPINVFKDNQWGTYRYLPLGQQNSVERLICDKNKSYVIVGGLGGFGLEFAEWLVGNGATKLVLVSRVGVQTGYQKRKIRLWNSSGVSVIVSTKDVSTRDGCLQLIQEVGGLGPVDGIFNLSLVLKDAFLENQTENTFKETLASKASAATYLDNVTRECCHNLRYFVMFSSTSCGRGNPSQSNYGMTNSVMERVCEKRRQDGLPGLAIQWGPIADVGFVASATETMKISLQGFVAQKPSSCLDVLEEFLNQTEPVVSSVVIAEKNIDTTEAKNVLDRLAYLLGIKNARSLSRECTLADLGMDSMSGSQFVQILNRDYKISLSVKDLRNLTISELIEYEEKSKKNAT